MSELFKVMKGDRFTTWIATDINERLVVYVAHTRSFHWVPSVETEVFFGCDLTIEPITEQEALDAIASGAGQLDGRRHRDFRAELDADMDRVPLVDVIALAGEPRTVRDRAVSRANDVADGGEVVWREYPAGKRASAYALASKIRNGKIKALPAGTVARVETTEDGRFAVHVSAAQNLA